MVSTSVGLQQLMRRNALTTLSSFPRSSEMHVLPRHSRQPSLSCEAMAFTGVKTRKAAAFTAICQLRILTNNVPQLFFGSVYHLANLGPALIVVRNRIQVFRGHRGQGMTLGGPDEPFRFDYYAAFT